MGILAHGVVEKRYRAAQSLQFLQQHHLVDIVARYPVRSGDDQQVDLTLAGGIAEPIPSRPRQAGATVPVVPKDMFLAEVPAWLLPHLLNLLTNSVELLINGLRLDLVWRRDAHIHGYPHALPPVDPVASERPALLGRPERAWSL